MKRVRLARKREVPPLDPLQPKLVLPQENSDEHPLMRKYAKISERALKNSQPDLEDDPGESLITKVG